MLVAFDARPLSGKITGIGRYTLELVSAMASMRPDTRWVAMSHEPLNFDLALPSNLVRACSHWNFPADGILWSQTALPLMLNRLNPDVFWSPRHHLPLVGLKKSIKTVLTVHDAVFVRHPETMRKANLLAEKLLFSRSINRAKKITSVSNFTRSELVQLFGVSKERIKVVPGAPFTYDEVATSVPIPKKYILAVGTLEPRKNLTRLISAYQSLPASLKDSYQLIIVGVPGWKEKLDTMVSGHNIKVTGYVSDGELSYLYAHASLFVFASLYEGFGLPLIEAFRSGTPVVASNCSSLPEVAGGAALLVNPLSEREIADGIESVLISKELASTLCEAGRMRALDFSWTSSAEAMWDVFCS